jgi:hypothetical protein
VVARRGIAAQYSSEVPKTVDATFVREANERLPTLPQPFRQALEAQRLSGTFALSIVIRLALSL